MANWATHSNLNGYPPSTPVRHRNRSVDINDEISEEDDLSEFDDLSEDGFDDLKPKLHYLGLSKSYVPGWKKKEAFREFYQNWKDAIVASFNIDPRAFETITNETRTQIQITVHRTNVVGEGRASKEILGYILYKKNVGSLELTNFKASLEARHLSLGQSSKVGQDKYAGNHGEGFKIAALVMHRGGHSVRIESSSYYWNFGFRGAHRNLFCCKLSQPNPSVLSRKMDSYADKISSPNFKRGLTANMWEDVTVQIGKLRGNDNSNIAEHEFRDWMKISIDLHRPQPGAIIRTKYGDLILDPQFFGQIYLKGLLVSSNSSGGKNFIFGYNFTRGYINRDRQRLENPSEEAEMLAKIWHKSIVERGDDIIDTYVKLFHDNENCADIALATEKVSLAMAKLIWQRLRSSSAETFYYCENSHSESNLVDQAKIVSSDLKKKPVALPKALWEILRKFSLVRTPDEERIHLFMGAERVGFPEDIFCASIVRALTASLALDPRLKIIEFRFVRAGESNINLLFDKDEQLLLIHEKWIDFQKIHESSNCEIFTLWQGCPAGHDAFFCDHIAEELLELIIDEIRSHVDLNRSECLKIRRLACARIRQTPRLIRILSTSQTNELEVNWTGNESGLVFEKYAADIQYHVVLHKMNTCDFRKNELLHVTAECSSSDDVTENVSSSTVNDPRCNCPTQVVSRVSSKAVFSELDSEEHYFAMVSRAENLSYFGVPTEPINPGRVEIDDSDLKFLVSDMFVDSTESDDNSYTVSQFSEDSSCEMSLDESTEDTDSEEHALPTSCAGTSPTLASSGPANLPLRQLHVPQGKISTASPKADEDVKTWRTWCDQELQLAFTQLIPRRQKRGLQVSSTASSYKCDHIDYVFEQDEYAIVRLLARDSPEYVVLVHGICHSDDESGNRSYQLLVTKYSMLKSTAPFHSSGTGDYEMIGDKELILHFEDFSTMGTQHDAELIDVRDICFARDFDFGADTPSDGIDHVVEFPPVGYGCRPFCRFGIRSIEGGDACITPIASSMLQTRDRWRKPKFTNSTPLVFDCTPQVLGPSEGFSQAGLTIQAALGFDPGRDITWRARYSSSQIYDGSPPDFFAYFDCSTFRLPPLPAPEPPKLAVIAGEQPFFRLQDGNEHMPSVEEFLKPLDILDATSTSPICPDFLIALMSPAVLHSSAIDRFSQSVLTLLERRLSVHIKLCSLLDHGLPQNRNVLVVVASPDGNPLPWSFDRPIDHSEHSATVHDLIEDLTFENPRPKQGLDGGFICSYPCGPDFGEGDDGSRRYVYNHETGQQAEHGKLILEKDVTKLFGLGCPPRPLVHPTRNDVLTVRELARLQGFPDDFLFYGSRSAQYKDVGNALPPIIAKQTGLTLLRVIQSLIPKVVDASRPAKRARVEDGDEVMTE